MQEKFTKKTSKPILNFFAFFVEVDEKNKVNFKAETLTLLVCY